MHASLRVGKFWSHIPGYRDRASCPHCNDPTESLDHILTACPSPERTTVWNLARSIWPTPLGEWQNPTFGLILGCGSISPPNHRTGTPPLPATAQARARRILISESAYLIWTLRCERVIAGKAHTVESIRNRWIGKINLRLLIDRQRARSLHRPGLKRQVQNTWTPLLANQPNIPPDWVTDPEVLVGIALPRPFA